MGRERKTVRARARQLEQRQAADAGNAYSGSEENRLLATPKLTGDELLLSERRHPLPRPRPPAIKVRRRT